MRLGWLFLAVWTAHAAAPTPPGWQVLYKEDFERGNADAWGRFETETDAIPWAVKDVGGNRVFAASGHATTFLREGAWSDFRLRVRVRLIRGSFHLNYRLTTAPSMIRYYIRLEPGELSLNRIQQLTSIKRNFEPGRWYALEVVGVGAVIQVYVDGIPQIEFNDPDPVLFGGVGFECLPGSQVEVDDVEIFGSPAPAMPAWVKTGGPLGGIGYDIRMHPKNPDLMYVTDASSGVYLSTDGGRNWLASNSGIINRTGPSGDGVPIFCLTIDPNNPDIIWAGTQDSRGVYKSTDAGKTWIPRERGIVEKNGITFRGFTVDPRDSRIVYAAGEVSSYVWAGRSLSLHGFDMTKGVVYKTTDGGENWRAVWRGDNLARYIWLDPRNPEVVYVSTGFWDREAANADGSRDFPGGVGILKSRDGGLNWRVLNQANGLKNLFIGSLFMHPANPDILLAGVGHNNYWQDAGVYRTTDGGETWQNMLPDRYLNNYTSDNRITAVEYSLTNPNVTYATSAQSFFRSDDGGQTWDLVSGLPDKGVFGAPGVFPGSPSDLQVDPRNPDRVFMNNYTGGNFLSDDGGRTWTSAARGYTGVNLNDIAVDPIAHGRVYVVGRSGVYRSDDGGLSWEALNYVAKNWSEWLGWIRFFAEWRSVATAPTPSAAVVFGDSVSGMLWRSTDRGRDWRIVYHHPAIDLDAPVPRHGFKTLVFSATNPNVVYAGMARDRLEFESDLRDPSFGVFRSADGGETWREVNDERTAQLSINALAVDPRSENIAYAGTASSGILRTLDGGCSWGLLNQGLRGTDVRALAVDPKNWTVLYAGLEGGGVYKSTNAGASWQPASAGMDPNAMVRDIVIDPTNSNVVYAADLRTGVYRSEDGGKLWVQINSGLRTRAVKALALSSDGGTLYAATEGEGVFRLDLKPLER